MLLQQLFANRIVIRRQLSCILFLRILTALAGCNTDDELERQRIIAVKRERAMLASFLEALKRGDFSANNRRVIAFVSGKSVNDALSGLAAMKIELPNTSGATLTINKVSVDFRTGFPGLKVDATIERSGLSVSAFLAARIDAQVNEKKPDVLSLNIHVDALVPEISWGMFDFRVRGFVRDIAQSKLADMVNGPSVLARVTLPLTSQFTVNVPSFSVPMDLPGARVSISAPALGITVKTQIEKIIFLRDGIHVFGKAAV